MSVWDKTIIQEAFEHQIKTDANLYDEGYDLVRGRDSDPNKYWSLDTQKRFDLFLMQIGTDVS